MQLGDCLVSMTGPFNVEYNCYCFMVAKLVQAITQIIVVIMSYYPQYFAS